jgi:hypothetical protein
MEHTRLPFGGGLTVALFTKILETDDYCRRDGSEFMPALAWCDSTKGERWGLFAIEKKHLRPDTIFAVKGVSIHVDHPDQAKWTGHTLDWDEAFGIVDEGTPNI